MNLFTHNVFGKKGMTQLALLILPVLFFGVAQAANVTVECLDSGNCADLRYNNHKGKVTAVCAPSATQSNLPVRITLNGDVYTGTLDCDNSTTGPWTVTGPGPCTQECGGGQQFFTVTCAYDTCTGPRPADSQSCNTQACENCDSTVWRGDDPTDVCAGQLGIQTNECGDERNVTGTWNPQDWSPDTSLVCSFEEFYQGTSCGRNRQVSGSLDCQPTWQWLRPAEPTPLVSANPNSDYNNLRLTGDLYYPLAGKGFFAVNDVRATRVVLTQGGNEYEYVVPIGDVAFGNRSYDFIIDMSDIAAQTPAGLPGPVALNDGDWEVDVLFEHRHDGMASYDWIRNDESGTFVLDSSAPAAEFAYKQSDAPQAESFAENALTNEPGWLWVNCVDQGPAGCLGNPSDFDADARVDDYQPFQVKGNFCADADICDTVGVNEFEVCDLADNCTTLEAEINNYDPIAPTVANFVMGLEPDGSFLSTVFKASSDYFPRLEYVDPGEVGISVTPSVIGSQAYILADVYNELFDGNACGDPSVSPFTLEAALCVLQNKNYPPNCEDLASCPDACPANYVWNDSLNRCDRASTCVENSWTPDVSDICAGNNFIQVSNCGNRQTRTGSRDCTATGNWRVTSAPSCPTACGQPASTQVGAVTCPSNNCDASNIPSIPTRSCGATSSCGPVYNGTWQTTAAPACPAACGQPASTRTGTVTCPAGKTCDPALRPAAPTRSCSATSSCGPGYNGTWQTTAAPACPTACGQSASTQTGTVTCPAGRTCNPALRPAAPTRSCSATSACTVAVNGACAANGGSSYSKPSPTCSVGSEWGFQTTASGWVWYCLGQNGGSNAPCAVLKRVNGACGTSNNTCTAGTLNDVADNGVQYLWNCNGQHGGTTANCSLPKSLSLCRNFGDPNDGCCKAGERVSQCECYGSASNPVSDLRIPNDIICDSGL